MSEPNPGLRKKLQNERPLPEAFEAKRPYWDRASDTIADALTAHLSHPVEAREQQFRFSNGQQARMGGEDPGILVPLTDGGPAPAWAIVPKNTVRVLSKHLLSCVAQTQSKGGPTDVLDTLLVRDVVACVVEKLATIVESGTVVDGARPVLQQWPLQDQDEAYFVVELNFRSVDNDLLTFALFLSPTNPALRAERANKRLSSAAAAAVFARTPVRFVATLDRWQTSAEALIRLERGSILPLRGARMDCVTLATSGVEGTAVIGEGEHGRHGGLQAVRLTSLGASRPGTL